MFKNFSNLVYWYFKDTNVYLKNALKIYNKEDLDELVNSAWLEKICWRVFIFDIHKMKNAGKLHGETPEEQYTYYKEVYLNNESHIKDLCVEFPEMQRLISIKVQSYFNILDEILDKLEADKEQIIDIFCHNRRFEKVMDLDLSAGDSHNGGRCAAKVTLDNGTVLYYKPHSIQKNVTYQETYEYLCEKAGISCKKVKYLSRSSYGWEENIENKVCHTKEEIRNYYFRMGIHLFIGYALSATDLHGENIIAHGEYPVIVDMETFPGYYIQPEECSAERKIETIIAGSVIHTGMLPVLTWGQGFGAVIMSALNHNTKITTPFRMPVVKNDKRSDIYIAYEPVEFEMKECVVRLNGEMVNAGEYTEDLVQGFQAAYCAALSDTYYIGEILSGFFKGKSRVILRHTQQYVMYQMASLHPDYMKDKTQREQLLSVIHKDGESQIQKEIRDYEISSLVEMDIPYFEIGGYSRALYDGNGKKYDSYYPHTPFEVWKKHLMHMNEEDMNRQCDLIRLSMALLNPVKDIEENRGALVLSSPEQLKGRMGKLIEKTVSWLCESAVIAEEDINWIGLHFFEKDRWSTGPSGMYLYSGISGIVVLLAEYAQNFSNEKAEKIFRMASKKLIRYTEQLHQQKNPDTILRTGLYDGEGSIVYSYLLLYKITGDTFYLNCAEKHFHAMERYLPQDDCYDLLAGNAGAIAVAVMLYHAAGDKGYLDTAVKTEQLLWEHRHRMEQGVGWNLKHHTKPLAGMAHGNSGFLMAYSMLYEAVGDTAYLDKIRLLLEYEDSLYTERTGNWKDLRASGEEDHFMNAWCHGAPGILISRLMLSRLVDWEIIRCDIQRAAQALFVEKQNGQICLCHGTAGRLLIMKQYLKDYEDREFRKLYNEALNLLVSNLENQERVSAAEYLNPAFMNGISGVVLALIELYKDIETPL